MKQQAFENLYSNTWQNFELLLTGYEKGEKSARKKAAASATGDFTQEYRKLCHIQSVARKRQYSRHLQDKLDNLALRGYQVLYREKSGAINRFFDFILFGFPRLCRREYRLVLASTLLLYLPGLIFFLLVRSEPELMYTLVPPAMVNELEQMYNPANEVLGSGRNSSTDLQMFGHYIYNNIGIAFRTFASGIFLGLGAVFILCYNGLILGGVSAWMVNLGYEETFFSFVIGHGSFELTAITIAGAAGMKIGFSLLSPGQNTRMEALRLSAESAVRLVGGAGVMLLVAAFIEGYWSSSTLIPSSVKYIVGALLWLLVFSYLLFSGRARGSE